MGRIQNLFKEKRREILSVYCTAGFPKLNSTLEVMEALQFGGADMIELGMPYSDPLADGPVIQQSSTTALANGMTLKRLFTQLRGFRKRIKLPVLLMGYMNPALQLGFETFCRMAAEAGVDGLIIPDLPIYEFESEYGKMISRYGLDFVFLVTPETGEERVRKLDSLSTGFLYAVSTSATTGRNVAVEVQTPYFMKLQAMHLKNPVLVGFGIKDKQSFSKACQFTNGAIIGTAYIQAIADAKDIKSATVEFLNSVVKEQQKSVT